MSNEIIRTNRELVGRNVAIELIQDSKGAIDVTALEAIAFNGDGEDIFTIATIGKIGWIWGARDGDKLIGAIEMIRENDPDKGFVHGVIIHPDNQYHGLGTYLIKHVEEKALELGMSSIECTIATTNGPSLNAFLNKCGYSATKFIPNCYGEGSHRLWITRNLNQKIEAFDYDVMLAKQKSGEKVFFVEDDNYDGIQELLSVDGNVVVGVADKSRTGLNKNLLCVVNYNSESVTSIFKSILIESDLNFNMPKITEPESE